MEHYCYEIELAGSRIIGEFEYPETAEKFGAACLGPSLKSSGVRVPAHELKTWLSFGNEPGAQFEFSCFTAAASDAISRDGRFIVHAVAFRWRDRAYLITAPSGEGKSTLLATLQTQYPYEFQVICGDRPVLWQKDDGSLWVYPSPWNGKENWHGAEAAPLAGTVLLKRTGQNLLERMSARQAAAPIYNALIQTRKSADLIHRFAGFASAMIQAAPVWFLQSREATESAPLLYEAIIRGEETE